MNIDAVDEIQVVNVFAVKTKEILVHQFGITLKEIPTEAGELRLNHLLNPCIFHDIDKTLKGAALGHHIFNDAGGSEQCVANFVTQK